MRRSARPLLLGALAAAALGALAATAWLAFRPDDPLIAEEALPLPPEAPRLAEGPEVDTCFALLRRDAEEARIFAARWLSEEGGEAAVQCEALARLALGEARQAAEQLETLAMRSRASHAARAAVFAQAAQAWLLAGQGQRAFAASTLALTLTPDDPELLIDRAVALGSLGRHAEAVPDLDRALALDPERSEALVFRAATWRHLDRIEPARRDIERALALAPANPEALLERGILRQLMGDTEGARMDWERAIEVAPGSAAAELAEQNLALSEAGPARR
jgi:Flp pilus assembly protein TadD